MRTTLGLPEKLLDEAMKLIHTSIKTGVTVLALRELIRIIKACQSEKAPGKG